MERITDKHLQAVVDRINRTMGAPMEPWVKQPDGSHKAAIGNFHLDHAYGGVNLVRMVSDDGGTSNALVCGCIPKRDLYERMHAFLRGIEAQREAA